MSPLLSHPWSSSEGVLLQIVVRVVQVQTNNRGEETMMYLFFLFFTIFIIFYYHELIIHIIIKKIRITLHVQAAPPGGDNLHGQAYLVDMHSAGLV